MIEILKLNLGKVVLEQSTNSEENIIWVEKKRWSKRKEVMKKKTNLEE